MEKRLEHSFQVPLNISAREMEKLYRGQASTVSATALSGETLRFPARCLREFVTPDGVRGLFEIKTDSNFKFISLKKF